MSSDVRQFHPPPLPEQGEAAGVTEGEAASLNVQSLAPLMEPDSLPPYTGRVADTESKTRGVGQTASPEYRLIVKVLTGLVCFVCVLLVAVVFLVGYLIHVLERSHTPAKQDVSLPVASAPLDDPVATPIQPIPARPAPEPAETQKTRAVPEKVDTSSRAAQERAAALAKQQKERANAYHQSVRELEQVLRAISGQSNSTRLELGTFENIEQFYQRMLITPWEPLFKEVLSTSGLNWQSDQGESFVSFDRLWKVGTATERVVRKRIQKVRERKKAAGIEGTDSIDSLSRWLSEWLLGKRGLYCQLRARLWFQDRSEEFTVEAKDKLTFGQIKRERRSKIVGAGYPNQQLYNWCDRNVI